MENLVATGRMDGKPGESAQADACKHGERDAKPCWVGAWSLCHTDLSRFPVHYDNQTFRTVMQVNLAGDAVRLRVSNRYGRQPVKIGVAAIALADEERLPASNPVPLLFGGVPWTELEPGEEKMSDPATLNIGSGDWLVVDLHLPGKGRLQSGNVFPMYHRVSQEGMQVGERQFQARRIFLVRGLSERILPVAVTLLSGLDVFSDTGARAVVAFGDSITALNQWTGPFSQRLLQEFPGQWSLLNQGISGNRLRYDSGNNLGKGIYGPAGILRFEHDVLTQCGVGAIISLIGVNDLMQPGLTAPRDQETDVDNLVDGMRGLIHLAHEKGIRIIGGTITPFAGYLLTHTPEREAIRQEVNAWIREGDEFDGVIDFDAVVRDPVRPERLVDGWHMGDRLHPNAYGGKMMASQIRMELLL